MGTSSTSRRVSGLCHSLSFQPRDSGRAGACAGRRFGEQSPGIAKQGYFFAGGSYLQRGGRAIHVGQMYVEFEIPQKRQAPYPNRADPRRGLTGTYMMGPLMGGKGGTRSSAPGLRGSTSWNQTGRGKSPITRTPTAPLSRGTPLGIQQRSRRSSYTHVAQGASPTPVAGPRTDRGSHLRSVLRLRSRGLATSTVAAEPLDSGSRCRAARSNLVRRSILTISQSGPYGWLIADARPSLVKGLFRSGTVRAAAHQCRFSTGRRTGSQAVRSGAWGITAIPMTYSPRSRIRRSSRCEAGGGRPIRSGQVLAPAEPARQLPNLKHTPILIVTSDRAITRRMTTALPNI